MPALVHSCLNRAMRCVLSKFKAKILMFAFIISASLFFFYLIASKGIGDLNENSLNHVNATFPFLTFDADNRSFIDSPTLVHACLGKDALTKHQSYIWDSLRQSRLMGGASLSIVVIINKAGHNHLVERKINRLGVNLIIYEDLINRMNSNAALHEDFRRSFFVQGLMVPGDNYEFNRLTTERLFAVYAYMNVTRKSNIFHMENDNMLYFNLSNLLSRMHKCKIYLGIIRASVSQAVLSFMYIQSASALEHLLRYIIQVFRLGKTESVKYLNTEYVNDMTITARYLDLSMPKSVESDSNLISQLPVTFDKEHCCVSHTANDKEKIIFDARTIGQYFGGDYWHPNVSFWTRSDFLDPRGEILIWKPIKKGIVVPYIRDRRIVNLHVHSKNLYLFSSKTANQPTGFGNNYTITAD